MAYAIRRSFFLLLSLLAAESASPEPSNTMPGAPVQAIWHLQKMHFRFHSTRTSYACDALERKVADILRALGAREDIDVDPGCFRGEFVSGAAVQVTLAAPVPATDANVRQATTFDSRDELLARLRGIELPTATDLERFPAAWRRISLQRDRLVRLEQGDCDLLLAMRKHIFPKLAVRVDEKSFRCSSFATHLRPRVEAAALFAIDLAPIAFVARWPTIPN